MKRAPKGLPVCLAVAFAAALAASCLAEQEPPPAPGDLEKRNRALAEVEAQFAILEDADGPTALRALGHKDYRVRARAARRLGELGEKAGDAGPELAEALEDKKRDVRLEAAAALANANNRRVVEPLIKALVDKDPKVRMWAWKSLRKMQELSIPLLISHLKSTSRLKKLSFKDEAKNKQVLRNEIIRLLPTMGGATVVPLSEALFDGDRWLKRTSATVLGKIGAKAKPAVPKLILALEGSTDNEQKVQIAMALAKIDDHSQTVLNALGKFANDRDKRVARETKKAIKALEDAAKKEQEAKDAKSKKSKPGGKSKN